MAYKFQLGAYTASGSLKQEGVLECDTSLTIGNAAMTEADLEKLDGITNGTAAANKAVVLDGSKNIATIGTLGCGAITSTGASSFGSATPASADGGALGSAALEWSDLYLADAGVIYMGNDQDVKITHEADSGITLSTVGDGGSGPAAVLNLHYDSASPAANDNVGAVKFKGENGAPDGEVTSYAEITGVSKGITNGAEIGALSFDVLVGGTPAGIMDICKTTAATVTISDGAYNFNIASHDGTNGLALAGTIVTADAGELNKMDGVTATTAELNYLDITTLGSSEASKAVSADASGDITIVGANGNMTWDKSEDSLGFADDVQIAIGTGGDLVLLHDGTDSYIGNSQGALNIATLSSGIAVSIGHTTSETTVNDNLTVTGDLTVNGTTTSINSTTIAITSSFTFEGATPDAHETILGVIDPTADATFKLPALSAGTYHIPALAGTATDASSAVTAAEFALLDGGSSIGNVALAAGDGFMHNDNGTMKQTTIEKIGDFLGGGAGILVSSGVLSVNIDTLSALGGTGVHQTQDHFMFSDNGTEKKITFSNLQDAVFADVSGDATVAAGGALTIANDAVESGMLNDNCISGLTELAAGGVATADELMISDGGTLKRIGVDSFKAYANAQDVQLVDDSGTLAVGMNYWADLAGAEAATLPASPTVGDIVYVKAASNCSSTNTITINKAGSQLIDGSASIILESPYAAVSLCYVVSNVWRIF